ncbi:sulfotransferase family 2 domain-containing protein [Waterburya agarophytonicola K14]|uniref:Sulfotransferase family 2 domain-containing protein n=1 Tax=Waterburya agarophytonicola KI4 TaxID=2874699 RepID=A0A964BSN2_9CYAN|nr:sulfotransferase family 2 domain-containing protein [Waterburya agarophytonicola KI4]
MVRFLKYSAANYNALNKNGLHNFAQNHSLHIYESNSIYSFIPKNACSTMRTSIAYANGCIDNSQDFNWIHKNNQTFRASLSDLIRADYTFVILRCPYARLASLYLDKIVSKYPPAWNFYDLIKRTTELDNISFTDFVNHLSKKPILNGDIHWRQQTDFLVYQQYDDYFCLEDFKQVIKTLNEKIGLDIIDARDLTNHGINKFELVDDENYAQVKSSDILRLKTNGYCPTPKSLYSDKLIEKVKTIYEQDLKLYQENFPQEYLMF